MKFDFLYKSKNLLSVFTWERLLQKTNKQKHGEATRNLGRFPFVRTDRPDHSRRNDNFPFNQNSPARSVKSWIACTEETVFQQKLLEKANFIIKLTGRAMVRPASSDKCFFITVIPTRSICYSATTRTGHLEEDHPVTRLMKTKDSQGFFFANGPIQSRQTANYSSC